MVELPFRDPWFDCFGGVFTGEVMMEDRTDVEGFFGSRGIVRVQGLGLRKLKYEQQLELKGLSTSSSVISLLQNSVRESIQLYPTPSENCSFWRHKISAGI